MTINIGDVIQLKSGGPLMTAVATSAGDDAMPFITAFWLDKNNWPYKNTFPQSALRSGSDIKNEEEFKTSIAGHVQALLSGLIEGQQLEMAIRNEQAREVASSPMPAAPSVPTTAAVPADTPSSPQQYETVVTMNGSKFRVTPQMPQEFHHGPLSVKVEVVPVSSGAVQGSAVPIPAPVVGTGEVDGLTDPAELELAALAEGGEVLSG